MSKSEGEKLSDDVKEFMTKGKVTVTIDGKIYDGKFVDEKVRTVSFKAKEKSVKAKEPKAGKTPKKSEPKPKPEEPVKEKVSKLEDPKKEKKQVKPKKEKTKESKDMEEPGKREEYKGKGKKKLDDRILEEKPIIKPKDDGVDDLIKKINKELVKVKEPAKPASKLINLHGRNLKGEKDVREINLANKGTDEILMIEAPKPRKVDVSKIADQKKKVHDKLTGEKKPSAKKLEKAMLDEVKKLGKAKTK